MPSTDIGSASAVSDADFDARLARWEAIATADETVRISRSEFLALLDALHAEQARREEAERLAALFGDQSDRFETLFLTERKRVEAAVQRERDARLLLGQAGLQIRKLHENFGETSSGRSVLARIRQLAEDRRS